MLDNLKCESLILDLLLFWKVACKSTVRQQKVNNELYWVAPLLHSGFFKWLNNREGTPGYVLVSATNERDVKLVQTVNNQPVKIKYQSGAYFQGFGY